MNRLLFVLLTISQIISAQKSTYKISQLNIESGLAHNTVECIFRDSEGYMWFGTNNGLNRYNGSELTTYRYSSFSKNSIAGNKILSLNEDNLGRIWIGTAGQGICILDKEKNTFTNYNSYDGFSSLTSNNIHAIKHISDTIWVCTGNGVAYFDSRLNKFQTFYPGENSSASMYDMIKTRDNRYYVSSNDRHIYEFFPGTGSFTPLNYERSAELSGNYKKHLLEDKLGDIWISAYSHGLARYTPSTKESVLYTPANSSIPSSLFNSNIIAHNNQLIFTTEGHGIIGFDINKNTFEQYTLPDNFDQLNTLSVNSILIDSEGIFWLGTFNNGVYICNPNQIKFKGLPLSNSKELNLRNTSVLSVFEDSEKNTWIGTDGKGIYRYDDGKLTQFTSQNTKGISSNRIMYITENYKGEIMFGTYLGGLIIYSPTTKQFRNYQKTSKSESQISSNNIWSILPDSNLVWLGLLGNGLDIFNINSAEFKNYGPYSENELKVNHNNILDIMKDRYGNIWFATEGAGISIKEYEKQRIEPYIYIGSNLSPSSNNINTIYESSAGEIWIGTENGGLNHFNFPAGDITYITKEEGLPSNVIASVLEDKNSNIWIGTAYGLSKIEINTLKITNYGIDDGMPGFICNRNALCERSDGSFIVGTTSGLFTFHPDSIHSIQTKVKPILTKLIIQNNVVRVGDTIYGDVILQSALNYTNEIQISPKNKTFSIEFAALSYTLPEKSLFRYKLEGFDNEWYTTNNSKRSATYTNLQPGTYTFKLVAANIDGVWSDVVKRIQIKILPTFWQTLFFKFLLAFTFIGMLVLAYFYWVYKRAKHHEKEKEIQQQKIILLEKEKLESELNNQTFSILNRNRMLLNHKSRLRLLKSRLDTKYHKSIKLLIAEIDNEVNEEKDWKHIEPRLDKVYNNFMTSLKNAHPDLNQNELRVAAYVRMGLSSKEITEIMQKTLKAVDSDRYRLRKKLDIPQNGSLKKYLLEL